MLFIDSVAFDATLNWMANGLLDFSGWQILFVILGLTHVTIASVTIFLHRHQAHRSLDLHPIASHFFRFWLWMTTGQVTKEWAAIHRKHHAKCEQAEDPTARMCTVSERCCSQVQSCIAKSLKTKKRSAVMAMARQMTGWNEICIRASLGKAWP